MLFKIDDCAQLQKCDDFTKIGIFTYSPEEDINQIEGQSPVVYDNINDLLNQFVFKDEIAQKMKRGQIVVIRPINIV